MRPLSLVVVFVLFAHSDAFAQVDSIRTVALTGETVPDLDPPLFEYESFLGYRLNDHGDSAFVASMTGPGVTSSNNTVLIGAGGALIARSFSFAPSAGSSRIGSFLSSSLRLNNSGDLAFIVQLTGNGINGSNDRAMYITDGSPTMQLAFRTGFPVADLPAGVLFSFFTDPCFNDLGDLAFFGALTGTGVDFNNNQVIYGPDPSGSAITLLARSGDAAPGLGPDVVFAGFFEPEMNQSGDIAVITNLGGAGVSASDDAAVYVHSGGAGAVPLVREGAPAPGQGPGTFFNSFGNATINGSGAVAFRTFLTGSGVTPEDNRALFSTAGGSLAKVIRENDQAPGLAPGVLIDDFEGPALNSAGEHMYLAGLRGDDIDSTNSVVIIGPRGGLGDGPIVRAGDPAPGLSNGETFRFFFEHLFNGANQAVFIASLFGDMGFPNALYATDTNGVPLLIASEGGLLDVDDDPLVEDLREIQVIDPGYQINESGEVLFLVLFADGTRGLFVADVPSVAPVCLGDCDNSGAVDFNDLVSMLFEFGNAGDARCDADESGTVDFNDLVAALFLFGACP